MTENTPEEETATTPVDAPRTGFAVYDHAELRFVSEVSDEAAAKDALKGLRDADEAKPGRADGRRGSRYTVESV